MGSAGRTERGCGYPSAASGRVRTPLRRRGPKGRRSAMPSRRQDHARCRAHQTILPAARLVGSPVQVASNTPRRPAASPRLRPACWSSAPPPKSPDPLCSRFQYVQRQSRADLPAVSAKANGNTSPAPALRSWEAITVKVHRESTMSSTNSTGAELTAVLTLNAPLMFANC